MDNELKEMGRRFNPRTREGCDAGNPTSRAKAGLFQSTHPRGVRQQFFCVGDELTDVSIHAPARGATTIDKILYNFFRVSIHAPARGATTLIWKVGELSACFNPRTREGCDLISSLWANR